jgi:hypothetical protein
MITDGECGLYGNILNRASVLCRSCSVLNGNEHSQFELIEFSMDGLNGRGTGTLPQHEGDSELESTDVLVTIIKQPLFNFDQRCRSSQPDA